MSDDHRFVTRRYFLGLGAAGVAALSTARVRAATETSPDALREAIAQLEYLTPDEDFRNVGRGNPVPAKLPDEEWRAAGLDQETWELEVVPDPETNPRVRRPMSREEDTTFKWNDLMELAEEHAVRFLKVMSCNNIGPPLGTGLWEGVPLSTVIWKTEPSDAIRRVYYYGYHNEDPDQLFQSSLPIGRVLESPPGIPPVILCYKMNGQFLSKNRGAPVRIVVPEAYGFKSIKWLKRVVLTDKYQANDTYALKKNDIDSHMKTMARFITKPPESVRVGEPIPITGLAQVGMSGLKKVQYWLHPKDQEWPREDRYFETADWKDAEMLPPPTSWGSGYTEEPGARPLHQFDSSGVPMEWPLRYAIVHWATLLTDVPPGKYDLRCRSIDANGIAQPMPRPFLKSGRNDIESVPVTVEA